MTLAKMSEMKKRHHIIDISTMFQEADDASFRTILSNKSHVLYTYLSERPEISYSLRTRNHNKFLIPKASDLGDRHFIIRMLYKTYTDAILQTKPRPICRYRSLCTIRNHSICMYVCMNFVQSCVWQLFLKNKRSDEMPSLRMKVFLRCCQIC